jgi:hypothetical protein
VPLAGLMVNSVMRAPMPSVNLSAARLTVSILQPNSCSTPHCQQQPLQRVCIPSTSDAQLHAAQLSANGNLCQPTNPAACRYCCYATLNATLNQTESLAEAVAMIGEQGEAPDSGLIPHLDHPAVILPGVCHMKHVERGQLVPGNLQTGTTQQRRQAQHSSTNSTAGLACLSMRCITHCRAGHTTAMPMLERSQCCIKCMWHQHCVSSMLDKLDTRQQKQHCHRSSIMCAPSKAGCSHLVAALG